MGVTEDVNSTTPLIIPQIRVGITKDHDFVVCRFIVPV